MDDIKQLREEISSLDRKIVELLEKRSGIVKKIGELKRREGLSFYAPERENQIYKAIDNLNLIYLSKSSLKAIYKEIMSAAIKMEEPLRISYLGPEATFTHQAAIEKFGMSLYYQPEESIEDVFLDVEAERADFGVVPIENSIEGVVNYTLDMFVNSNVKIVSEIMVDIKHNLLSKADSLSEIKVVYSHPNALGQCKNWLKKHLPNATLLETSSTAKAAKIASKEKSAAAISSLAASNLYDLNVIAKGIEDKLNNVTRFLVIGKHIPSPSSSDKTSLMFSIYDKVGALFSILKIFYDKQINLTRIESRPSKQENWSYIFYVDIDGHIESENVKKAFESLSALVPFVKLLGSYPKYIYLHNEKKNLNL